MTSTASDPIASFWSTFELESGDLEFIYNLLLDREAPLTTAEMALPLIERRLERLRREAEASPQLQELVYQPAEAYQAGQQLVFPALGRRAGKVVSVRAGVNPDLGSFDVLIVEFAENGEQREFAARLADHALNRVSLPEEAAETLDSPQAVWAAFGPEIEARIGRRLAEQKDIVRIAGRWFPRALLAEINVGHLNLAEAVLDVAAGGPLPTTSLLEHVELPASIDPLLAEFSLDYALQEDERFDEVGPAGLVLWYLRRLEPPDVLFPPARLACAEPEVDRSLLTEELLRLERELDDEFSPLEPRRSQDGEVVLSLLFPHWRTGTLPLASRLRPLFPTAYEAPRIRFILVAGHTGDRFPGWVVRKERYVSGLEDWYHRYNIPPGGLIKVRSGEQPGEVVVEVADRRNRHDWVRTVAIAADNQIGFTMLKQPMGAAYDDRMVVGVPDAEALDQAWAKGDQRKASLERLVLHVSRELAKLNPQSAVHAQALYSGVNVLRRVPPAPVFVELVTRPHYAHVGDNYFRLHESQGGDG